MKVIYQENEQKLVFLIGSWDISIIFPSFLCVIDKEPLRKTSYFIYLSTSMVGPTSSPEQLATEFKGIWWWHSKMPIYFGFAYWTSTTNRKSVEGLLFKFHDQKSRFSSLKRWQPECRIHHIYIRSIEQRETNKRIKYPRLWVTNIILKQLNNYQEP